MPNPTPPVTPLPVAVELLPVMRISAELSTQIRHMKTTAEDPHEDLAIANRIAEIIDARIREHQRGLVEALKECRQVSQAWVDRCDSTGDPRRADTSVSVCQIAAAALRSAGAE